MLNLLFYKSSSNEIACSVVESHAVLGILRHSFLQDVGHSLKENHIHSVERILHAVLLLAAEIQQPAVRATLNVLNDESAVHSNELHLKSLTNSNSMPTASPMMP
jgi:hypothetical protein